MSRGLILGLMVAAAGALALRGPQLDLRPMHKDEAVKARSAAKRFRPDFFP
jgi:predicted membrane-bound mannosyltransferase